MSNEMQKIGFQSTRFRTVQGVMHYVNEQTLTRAHQKQSSKKAVGVDGINKADFDKDAAQQVKLLIEQMLRHQYRVQPVRRVYIPKTGGKLRPLGIPAYRDRLVQSVMADILTAVYEPRFLNCSCGFRPGTGVHEAVRYINRTVMTRRVNYVLEADIKGFFDNVNHDWLMKFLAHDIEDANFLRYVRRFLKAGIMEETELAPSDKGTPQGGQISPVLANVYLHYALDLWVEKVLRKHVKGEIYYVRYADDFLLMFQYKEEAEKALQALRLRMEKFNLELAEEKTRIIPFGRWKGNKEKFDFLGFTFYNTRTRKGSYRLGIRTSTKKMQNKLKAAKEWMKGRMHAPVRETMKLLGKSIIGHDSYYGINGNADGLAKFRWRLGLIVFRVLNRRSQRKSLTYDKFNQIWNANIPKAKIRVDIWSQRLFEEPNAGKPHVRFCEG